VLTRIFRYEPLARPLILAVALTFASAGCEKEEPWQEPGPAASFERFLMDWFQGEREAAFAAIVASDREALSAPLEKLKSEIDAEELPDKADMLVVGRVNNPYDFESIRPSTPLESAPEIGQRVELSLNFHDGREGTATMVWSGEKWLVDLPLKSTGEPSADDAASNATEQKPEQDSEKTPEEVPAESAPDDKNSNPSKTPPKTP
jgi:hypothetical protein